MINNLIYTIPKDKHSKEDVKSILINHPEIKFVSFVGIDLSGNDTDEKIPVKVFLDDLDSFLYGVAVQTDGSSVVLPGIATLNNAKVDMVADLDCKWFVDYNYDFIDTSLNKPIGTLRIPCFLYHDGKAVDSRHILSSAIKRTKGSVRTALEETLLLMEAYGFEPEMGHKEVGGVRAKLDSSGQFNHIMEQLEVDWKYADAVQAADNELFVKILTQETFRRNGLEVTFMPKPLDGVAGSGMHIHLGVSLKLKNGKRINLFHATKEDFLSVMGYGALMGILKNYEVMNPFISSTNNALKRLRPGFEAPICIVTSLGLHPTNPSRNRTVLVGLIRDLSNPAATRFELRSPNPHSNAYIAMAVSYMSMLDGILYAVNNNKTEEDLLKELSKQYGEDSDYLEKNRSYRSEDDVFEDFTEEERNKMYGTAPATIYENLSALDKYPEKINVLKRNDVLTDQLINSFKMATLQRWCTEIGNRIINKYTHEIRNFKPLHSLDKALDLDVSNWMKINELRHYIMKDSYTSKSLFTRIKSAFIDEDYSSASKLYLELESKMEELRNLYSSYKKNLLDI